MATISHRDTDQAPIAVIASDGGDRHPWIVAMVVAISTFMEVLDTTIAVVSLRSIAGSLGAGLDESTWILTSYLVANAVVMPVSGWLMTIAGRKRYFMVCTGLFTLSSLLCGAAPSLFALIAFRILQGASGGGLQPSAQAILSDAFPPHKRGQAFALYGVAVVVAPAVGPTLGGWITDNFSWHWIFLINVPVGLLSLVLTQIFVTDPPALQAERHRRLRGGLRIDGVGLALTVIGLGALELFLDEGERNDWFSSPFILGCAITSAIALVTLVFWEWFHPEPVVEIRLMRDRSFGAAAVMLFAIGFILYGSTQLLPQMLQTLMGYTATWAGLAMTPGGLSTIVAMLVVGFLLGKAGAQPRNLIIIGLLAQATALWIMSGFNDQIMYHHAVAARILQASSLAFLFVPINTAAFVNIPRTKTNNASALINVLRNIGGSVGIAVSTSLLSQRSQFHQHRLVEHLTPYDFSVRQFLDQAGAGLFGLATDTDMPAATQSLGVLYGLVRKQATMMAYVDIYSLMAVIVLSLIPAVFLLRRSHVAASAAMAH
ncbi:MAG: DHA2 family efflux MFS transporter permease subunit [Candidatus Sumerlaeaceae bacterium]|nr:DHA2 family efflux MFS transporter permease subunit [Candidatus Sumerlaeaceae bacterium]